MDSGPNGVHTIVEKEWRQLVNRINETHEIARRSEGGVREMVSAVKAIGSEIHGLRVSIDNLTSTILDAALERKPKGYWDPESVKALNRTHWAVITVLLFVIALLLVGEKAQFIRTLLP
jgi:hypothetical protein